MAFLLSWAFLCPNITVYMYMPCLADHNILIRWPKKKWLLTHTTTVGLLYTWMVIFSAFYQVFCRAFSHRAVFLGNTCLCLFCRQVLSFKCKLSFKYVLSLPLIYTLCVKYNSHIFMAPFEEGRASCFAPVCLSVGWSTNSFIFFAEVAQTEIKFCKHF